MGSRRYSESVHTKEDGNSTQPHTFLEHYRKITKGKLELDINLYVFVILCRRFIECSNTTVGRANNFIKSIIINKDIFILYLVLYQKPSR